MTTADYKRAYQQGYSDAMHGFRERPQESCYDCISRQAALEKAINIPIAKVVFILKQSIQKNMVGNGLMRLVQTIGKSLNM